MVLLVGRWLLSSVRLLPLLGTVVDPTDVVTSKGIAQVDCFGSDGCRSEEADDRKKAQQPKARVRHGDVLW